VITLNETRREVNAYAFPLHVSSFVKFTTFLGTTHLLYCKLILPRSIGCGGVGTRRPTNVATVAVARL